MVGHALNGYFLGFLLETENTEPNSYRSNPMLQCRRKKREHCLILQTDNLYKEREMAMMKSLGVHALW